MIKKPELLAPAGSITGLKAVIAAGADAVYIGGSRFGARAYADNPESDELISAIDYAHLRGVSVYLTVNTLIKDQELDDLYDFLLPYYEAGIDAVLVQDFGALTFIREHFPDLPVHASTQMTVTGPHFGKMLKSYGVTRLVPAREMTMDELRAIRKESGLEIEVFIHGALCCCYSGQCLYSSLLGGRSGNRGRCAQPCRLLYLKDDPSFDGKTSILNQKEARHFLSPKDLCTIDLIPEFFRSGMASLKIEGRMKQPEYAAGVTSVYRKYIDLYAKDPKNFKVTEADHQLLWDLYNRSGFTDGYLHRHNGPEMMAYVKHELTGPETEARHHAYDVMHERYVDHEKKIRVSMNAEIKSGEVTRLELSTGDTFAYVEGAAADSAKNRPLSAERIRESLAKTGNSDYEAEEVIVETDEKSFVPVSALNELRRAGLESLSEILLAGYRRSSSIPPVKNISNEESSKKKGDFDRHFQVSVLTGTYEQLKTACETDYVDTVIFESSLVFRSEDPLKEAGTVISMIRESGKKAMTALPFIEREGYGASLLCEHAEDLIHDGLSAFLVRSPESMAMLIERGLAAYIFADAGLYSFNRGAKAFLRSLKIPYDTAPFELNRKELYARDNENSDIVVYGKLPLMVTAQCLKKGTEKCTRSYDHFTLTDRMGVDFDLDADCSFCYNLVRNSVPLMLGTELDSISRMGFRGIRLQFAGESAAEMRGILETFRRCLAGEEIPNGKWTKGHFLRGVE